jgi:coenzyme F420-reducing hydrogenase alpha subunit
MNETFYQIMRRQGITRRSFLKFCSLTAAALGLGPIGAVEVSRGLLMHAARVEDGRIAAYLVLPPTRWNFDANGTVARWLRRSPPERTTGSTSLISWSTPLIRAWPMK